MKRRQFLQTSALSSMGLCATQSFSNQDSSEKRPNILVLMADDLGYSDLSCFGSEEIKTPVLDRLAQEGLRFTDFYAAAPNCSPSRAALLTGRIPARVGMYSYVPRQTPMHLPDSEITIAELLKKQNYDTAHIGKWHLCSDLTSGEFPTPSDQGFDYWFATENNAEPSHHNPTNFVRNGEKVGKIKGYSCQIVADEAIAWLNQHHNSQQPFYLNVWFHEPHRKVAAPPELLERHPNRNDAAYLACIENMDQAIGRILSELEEQGLAENTFVMFTSDNGSYHDGSNGGFRGAKSWVWEGGIRNPTIMRWPGHIDAGTESHTPASLLDVLPTICGVTKTNLPKQRILDGVNLTPLFQNKSIEREKPLFWYFYRTDPACAMREGQWSLIGYLDEKVPPGHSIRKEHMEYIQRSKLNRFELYNLEKDPTQSNDVSQEHPERLESLKKKMIALHSEVIQDGVTWFE